MSSDVPRPTPAPGQPGSALTGREWTEDVQAESGPGVRAGVSNAMVGLKKSFFGKGPVRARTYVNENFVFCVLEGGLTRSEETLLEAGEEHLVRQYRLRFQESMRQTTCDAVEQVTRRKVIGYQSQIVFDPTFGFELFVLDAPPTE